MRNRNSNSEQHTEGLLMLGVLAVLLFSLFLVYSARSRPEPADALAINEATASQIMTALGVDKSTAARLVGERDRLHGFDSTDQVFAPRLHLPTSVRQASARIIVRRAGSVRQHFAVGAIFLTLLAFFLPPWLRAKGIGGDPILLPLALLLTGWGVVMLFSVKDPLRDHAVWEHHLFGMGLALSIMAFLARTAPAARSRIKNYRYLWVIASGMLVILLFLFGNGPEGVKLNLRFFQPVELIKLMLVFFAASYLADRADLIADTSRVAVPTTKGSPLSPFARLAQALSIPHRQDIAPLLVMFAFSLLLFFLLKDLGPGMLLFGTFVALLYMTTGRLGYVALGVVLLLAGMGIGYRFHVGVFPTRVDMWSSPFSNPHANGMQLAQSQWAFASGGWEGSGLGLGMPGLIPRAGSDLAFASWAEETGLIGAWLTLTLYAVFVWRGIRIALRAANDFDRALAFGLTALFGLQTLIIVAGVTGAMPLTGISLPFLSYGNSALVADFALLGLLRGISASSGSTGGARRDADRLAPRREVNRAGAGFAVVYALVLLLGIGVCKLGSLQLLKADLIATRSVVTPDADKIARPHVNPRLLAIAQGIERGSIYDRNGKVLATSRPEELKRVVPIPEKAAAYARTHTRYYPYGPALAHLVGYLDPGVGGPFGFERGYDEALRGFRTYADLLPDYRRRNMPFYHPRIAQDLTLTIDADLQREAQRLLAQATGKLRDKADHSPKDRAAMVLIEPRTGNVLVAACLPTFDPNRLTPEIVKQYASGPEAAREHRFINRALFGLYPPGSTLKVATTACALENMPDAANFAVICNREAALHWEADGKSYARAHVRDDKGDPAFGSILLAQAFRVSSNIYFANLAVALGGPTFHDTLQGRFHFAHVPSLPHFDAQLPDIGYGQGQMRASPVEMARLVGTVANGGIFVPARYIARMTQKGKEKETDRETDPLGDAKKNRPEPAPAMKPETARLLRDLMHDVTSKPGGTAYGVFDTLPYAVGGKTGTAQNEQYDHEPHSWFIGFAPYAPAAGALPKYAFACVVENGGYGKTVAAVLCRDLLRYTARSRTASISSSSGLH